VAEEQIKVVIKLKDSITASLSKVRRVVEKFGAKARKAFEGIKRAVFSLKGALLALGTAAIAKAFVRAGADVENFRATLSSTLGSVQEGNKLFEDLAKYAGTVPFQLEEIIRTGTAMSGTLKGGRDEINQLIPLIGDLAGVGKALGISFEETGEQVMRMWNSGAASADRFREKGILAMMGFKAGVSYSVDETRKKILDSWKDTNSKFAGSAQNLSETWDGKVSMMLDAWFNFRRGVMEKGPMDFLKATLEVLTRKAKGMGDSTKATADVIVKGFEKIIMAAGYVGTALEVVKAGFYMLEAVGALAIDAIMKGMASLLDMIPKAANSIIELTVKIAQGTLRLKGASEEAINTAVLAIRIGLGSSTEDIKTWAAEAAKSMDEFGVKAEQTADEAADSLLFLTDPARLKPHEETRKFLQEVAGQLHAKAAADKAAAEAVKIHEKAQEGLNGALGSTVLNSDEVNENIKWLEEHLQNIDEYIDNIESGSTGLESAWDKLATAAKKVAVIFADAIYDSIEKAIEGTFEWQAALKDVAKDLSRMGFQMAMRAAFAAEGGVFPGFTKRMPIKQYAAGGITRGPEIAMIGEGKKPEAVVPLDNGKEIPINVRGGGGMGGGTLNVTIQAMDGADVERVLTSHSDVLTRAFAKAMRDNPTIMQR